MSQKRDTFEFIQALEGAIEPYAETYVDEKHLKNLKEWCELHERITDEIIRCANMGSLRCYWSAKDIIDYARGYLRTMSDNLDDCIKEWNTEESSKEDDNDENYF